MIESVVRVGLAGLGAFGRQHANVLAGLEGVELAAICDPRPESVAWVAERYNVPGRYADFDEMIARRTAGCGLHRLARAYPC